jgi:hypothetical protein
LFKSHKFFFSPEISRLAQKHAFFRSTLMRAWLHHALPARTNRFSMNREDTRDVGTSNARPLPPAILFRKMRRFFA